jgi:hypothetical protein
VHISPVECATTSIVKELVERVAQQHEHEMSTFKSEAANRLDFLRARTSVLFIFLFGSLVLCFVQFALFLKRHIEYPPGPGKASGSLSGSSFLGKREISKGAAIRRRKCQRDRRVCNDISRFQMDSG